MLPLLALALAVVALSRRNKTAQPSNTFTPVGTPPRQVPEWTVINQYKDKNGVLWTIEEKSYAAAYRGTAGPGRYAGRQFTLPNWGVLKTAIDAFAATQAIGAAVPGIPGVPSGDIGIPIGTMPGGGSMLGLGPTGVPEGAVIATTPFGATAPLQIGDRVTFDVVIPGGDVYGAPTTFLGKLEGAYQGPSTPSDGPARVVADRIALRTSEFTLPLGSYAIPASSSPSSHDRLQRVEWTVYDPSAAGLAGFTVVPPIVPGALATVLVADRQLNKVIAIAQIASIDPTEPSILNLRLVRPYRVVDDSGQGPVTFPSNVVLRAYRSQLVDPTSIPAA